MIPQPTQTTGWQPPANYEQVSSDVEGISVWQPRSKEAKVETPTTYTCPNCGASTRYDVAAGGVACEYCGYSAPVNADKVGRRAETFEFTLETLSQAEQGWGIERKTLHCENCGAELTVSEGTLSTTCPFCASNKVNLGSAASSVLRPRFLIPFKVQGEVVRMRVKDWLGKGWFHPSELASSTVIDRFTGIYLPFWTFGANISARWKAEVGYEHTESYYDPGSKSMRTRTVIRWRWENGQVGLKISDLLISGSSHASHIILERLEPFNLNDLVDYSPDYLAGWQAHAYDINLPQAWETGKDVMRERAKKVCYEDIPSPHVRNFSMSADFGDESWRYLLLPVYLAAYRFEEKVYQVMVNGQTGVVAGQKPVAWWKIWLAVAALVGPGLLIGLVGLGLMPLGGIGVIPLFIGLLMVIIGLVLGFVFYRQGVQSEAA
jgi:DNA-directed RNA polymerase subunit RPC12/RpoP